MTYRFEPPHPSEEIDREHPAARAERLDQSARDAEAVAETWAELDARLDQEPFDEACGPWAPLRRADA